MYDNLKVVIIVLDYNKPEMTNVCIENIYKYNKINLILVNNGDANLSQYNKSIPFHYVKNNGSRAFSKGMNEGLKKALNFDPEYIIFLNNDAVVTENAIKLLVDAMNYDNSLGMVSSNEDYSLGYLNKDRDISDFVDEKPIINYKKNLTGFCLCVRRKLIEELRGYDEDYVFGKEDDDLSIRVKNKGYKLAEIKNSFVYHKLSSSTNFGNKNDLDFLAYGFGLGYALLSIKHGKNIFIEFLLTTSDSLKLFTKVFLLEKKFNFSIFKNSINGFKDGIKRIHQ
ncbi:MAG: glycosyltransferase family 2 protein [Thermoplasmata archaeon]